MRDPQHHRRQATSRIEDTENAVKSIRSGLTRFSFLTRVTSVTIMARKLSLLLFVAVLSFVHADEKKWPYKDISEVRAFIYDDTQEQQSSLLLNGRLHKGVINDGGVKLNKTQQDRLLKALFTTEKVHRGAKCYEPHHGFVFYDSDGKMFAHVELCFQCGNVASSPEGLPKVEWDWKMISDILKELDIPILHKNEEYTALFKRKSKTEPRRLE